MNRPWRAVAAFAAAVVVLVGAMGVLTAVGLRLDRAEQLAQARATQEERVRLALWRMDAVVSPIVAVENARPYFEYVSFYSAERAYTNMFAPLQQGDVLVPSPLLTFDSPYVRIHFQYGPDGSVSSPQVPESNMRDLAEMGYLTGEDIEASRDVFAKMASYVSKDSLARALSDRGSATSAEPDAPGEYVQRQKLVQQQISSNKAMKKVLRNTADLSESTPAVVADAPLMTPVWFGKELFLIRTARVDERMYIQGCWLDWPALHDELRDSVADLFPGAALVPIVESDVEESSRRLAAAPIRLEIKNMAVTLNALSPLRVALAVAWVCVIAVLGAIGALLWGALALGERRAAFVSAVTHELRTPLTTFQLYTDMLAENRVPDESKRREYYATLRNESSRLRHLVENVMALARLERGPVKPATERVSVAALMDRIRPGLESQCARAGMAIEWDGAVDCDVETNAEMVEQILANLVDNACKYGGNGGDSRVTISQRVDDGRVVVSVRDYGPNLSADAARKLFRPFAKSAGEAAASAPGVGLGLALSRRLARSLGGDLVWRGDVSPGCCFELWLGR